MRLTRYRNGDGARCYPYLMLVHSGIYQYIGSLLRTCLCILLIGGSNKYLMLRGRLIELLNACGIVRRIG